MIQRYKKTYTKNYEELILYNKYKNKLSIPYPLKQNYMPIIPLNIYQTWYTKKLPLKMYQTVHLIKILNPKFNYQLFDDHDCREFIKNNFDKNVLYAFDTLIPGAYKADLWRYCILYKNGGIYLDIKYKPLNNFRFITMTEKEHWVLDVDKNGIYNALMVCKPGNPILLKAINKIVENVTNKYYGNNALEITGPLLLAPFFTIEEKLNFDMKHEVFVSNINKFIFFNDYIIFTAYNNYFNDTITESHPHYSELWEKKRIYNLIK